MVEMLWYTDNIEYDTDARYKKKLKKERTSRERRQRVTTIFMVKW